MLLGEWYSPKKFSHLPGGVPISIPAFGEASLTELQTAFADGDDKTSLQECNIVIFRVLVLLPGISDKYNDILPGDLIAE